MRKLRENLKKYERVGARDMKKFRRIRENSRESNSRRDSDISNTIQKSLKEDHKISKDPEK